MSIPRCEKDIPSSVFSYAYYCIFISKKAAPHFAEKINATSWRHQCVEVYKSTDQEDDLAVIVIPKSLPVWKYEKCLFEFKSENTNKDVVDSGFWGQHDIGYKSKTWNLVNIWDTQTTN